MEYSGYVFTFGVGHPLGGHYVRIIGDYASTRTKMCEAFGNRWAFQYSDAEWEESLMKPFPHETEIKELSDVINGGIR